VGRTPLSARVPLDPLFANRISLIHNGRRTGGLAPQFLQAVRLWEKRVALGVSLQRASARHISKGLPTLAG